MPEKLTTFEELASHVVSSILRDRADTDDTGTRYRLRLQWNARMRSWYADLQSATGAQLAAGRRLSPKWSLFAGLHIADRPPGHLFIRGPSEYLREMLGEEVEIVFYATSELTEKTTAAPDYTVTL